MTKKLEKAFCDAVQPIAGRQVSYSDGEVPGLELRVSGQGRKVWCYRYRTRSGQQRRATIAPYSAVFGPYEARSAALVLQTQAALGEDPIKALRSGNVGLTTEALSTFGNLATSYFKATEQGRYRPKRASTLALEKQVYRVHIASRLDGLPIELVTRRLLRCVLHEIADEGVPAQALRVQAIVRQMLAYAVFEERLAHNPIRDLPAILRLTPRARTYSDEELRAIWTGVDDPQSLRVPEPIASQRRDKDRVRIGRPMRIAIQLVFLLLQRRVEVLGMAVSEVDLKHGVWVIPAERMNSNRRHAVPLSGWAVTLIEEAIELAGGRTARFVFPGFRDPAKSMNGPSMNWAFNAVLWARGIKDGTINDIRRTGSTLMTSERIGISPFVRSKVLGHADAGGGAQISATHDDANAYIVAKRAALDQWQDCLRGILEDRAG